MNKKVIRFGNKSIFSKLLISYMLLIVFPVGIIGMLSSISSKKIIEGQITKSNTSTINQINKNISTMLSQIISVVNLYNSSVELKVLLEEKSNSDYDILMNRYLVENRMLLNSFALSDLKHETYIIGVNGMQYLNNVEKSNIDVNNLLNYDWYKRVSDEPNSIVWLSIHKSFGLYRESTNVFTAAKALYNYYTNKPYGILLLSIDESNLYNILKESANNQNEVFVMDTDGNIISHSNSALVGQQADPSIYSLLMSDKGNLQSGSKTLNIGNQKKLCIFEKVEKADWYIVQTIPTSVLLKESTSLRKQIFITSLVCMLFAIITAVLISRKLSMPLVSLYKKIKSHSALAAPIQKESELFNEVAFLSTEYDLIISKLEKTINDLVREQYEKRKIELKALQMQINPHFLYNTLNSIKCLVWTNKINYIEPTINSLVKLLRQTISSYDEFITVGDEIENVRNYIYIQQIRTDNSLLVSYNIDEELLKYKVPRLILQPIIENAIFHGIEPKGGKGCISIYCKSLGDDITVEVLDDGVGMDKNTVFAMLTAQNNNRERFSGIGTKNVDERLKLYFGSKYGLNISSEKGVGTSVTIYFPKTL